MSARPHPLLCCALLILLTAATAGARDRVLLKDGRVIDGTLIESENPDYVVLQLPGADIPIPLTMVEKTFVESMENYVPKNKKEEKLLKQGKVLFEGTWVSRTRREQELRKRAEADEEAIQQMRKEQNWKHRKIIETRHFAIESNCTQEVLDDYSARIEQYYDIFVDYWNIKLSPSEGKEKMHFYLYRNKPDFHEVTGTNYGIGGFFDSTKRELQLYDDLRNPAEARDTLQHETNHLLTYLINTKFEYPRWMNEGMAEYFGAAEITEDGEIELGGLQFMRIASLRNDIENNRVLPMRRVLMASPREYGFQHYAYGWSFVHFLMESEEYGKDFRAFFKNLHKNRDIEITNVSYSNVKGALAVPELPSVIAELEKALGKPLEELEEELKTYAEQAYGELSAYGYYRAARMSKRESLPDDEHIVNSMRYFQKAADLGYDNAECYREYAEMLRKGGIDEGRYAAIVAPPNPIKAYEMAQKAIELDPIAALNYTEAAGALVMDSPIQDLDLALAMTNTAKALSPRDWSVQSLTDELLALIEPARERAAERAAMEAELAAADWRLWMVQPFYFEGQEVPEVIDGLETDDLRELIRAGTVKDTDWIFQKGRGPDGSGGLLPAVETWDSEWVQLKDIPVFADDLAAAG